MSVEPITNEEFKIEEIRGKHTKRRKTFYLAKLENKDEKENVWLPGSDIKDKQLIKQFNKEWTDPYINWQWQYYIDEAQSHISVGWHYFNVSDNSLIENAIKNKQKLVEVQTDKYKYDIDMEMMVQTNTSTQKTRLLRRVKV